MNSSTAGVDENDNLPESMRRRADREVRYDSAKSTAEKEWMPAVHDANNAAVIDIAGEQRARLGATQISNTALLSSSFRPGKGGTRESSSWNSPRMASNTFFNQFLRKIFLAVVEP